MRTIAVLGAGYVGLVTGACLAELGNRVVCCDLDEGKIDGIQNGAMPFYEPGLADLIRRNAEAQRLSFTSDLPQAMSQAEFIYIAVGTPMGPSGEADLSYVQAAAVSVGEALRGYAVVVVKSTVPAGTARIIDAAVRRVTNVPFDVVSNPEFLREGTAIQDFMNMERAVIGARNNQAGDELERLYAPLDTRIVRTDWETAELIKYASNAFLAMKISFINSMANLCEKFGADVTDLAVGVGLDSRIGTQYLQAGIGYGGSCFPKDAQALLHMSESVGHEFDILKSVIRTNREQPLRFVGKVMRTLGGDLRGLTIAVLGLSFKPGTDDMRSAPSVPIIRSLLEAGASVRAFDPAACREARKHLGDAPFYTDALEEAVTGCDACIIVTEWPEIVNADLGRVRSRMKNPVIFDGRNVFSPAVMKEAGFEYHSIGRTSVVPSLNSVL